MGLDKQKMIMISFVIPIYNAERYISRCIDSIINQSLDDWELLLVDDGSNDSSSLICDGYARIDKRIHVYHRDNGGVSSARNYGIEQAEGEWVWFIDADDYLLEGTKDILEKAVHCDCQAIALSFMQEINSNEAYPYYATCELSEGIHSGERLINTKSTSPTVWSFLFRRDIILCNNLKMSSELKFGEDKIFILEYLSHAEKVLVLGTPVYRYVFCETSAVRQNYMRNEREIDDQLKSIVVLLDNSMHKNIDSRIFKSQIFYIVTQFLLLCNTSEIGYCLCKKKYLAFLRELKRLGYSSLLLKLINLGGYLFYNHPYLLKRKFLYLYFSLNRRRYNY